jgi:protein ImuB
MKRILCVRLPNWPLQRLVVALQSERGCWGGIEDARARASQAQSQPPILLYARDPRRGECIITCSRAAHSCGVRPGMPLAEAEALVSRSGHTPCAVSAGDGTRSVPTTYLHDPAADLAVLAKLAERCERFSPLVGWETVESAAGRRSVSATDDALGPSALFLDITGIGVLFGGEEQLLDATREEFVRQGYRVKLAIAETIGAAWALTFGEQGGCGGVRDTAAEASPTQPQPPAHPTLASLPIHTLRVPHETVDLLAQLGVTTIGQLLELPREALASRLGERLPLRLAQALGEAGEVIAPHHPPPSYEADWILEVPRGDWECLELIFQDLLKRIAEAMAPRQEGAVRLICRLDCAGAAPLKLEVGLFRPSGVAKHLWGLVRMQLEQRLLPGLVGRITVHVVQSAPLESRQSELFGGSVLEGTRELSLLIDRLSGRLGMDAVVRPKLARDPLPEKAFREMPLAGQKSPKSKVQSPKSRHATSTLDFGLGTRDFRTSVLFRPLELLDPPVILEVLSVVPDGPPIRFSFRGHVHRVARYWGPERIETGWWRGKSVRRDYYRIETEEGERFWLFRRLEDGAWGVQGVFA